MQSFIFLWFGLTVASFVSLTVGATIAQGQVRYFLVTQNDPNLATELKWDTCASNIQADKLTKVIVHGWGCGTEFGDSGGHIYEPLRDLKNAYLGSEDVNVIMVDWGYLSQEEYDISAENAVLVGEHTGAFIKKCLIDENGISPDNIHAIGHSLGGQMVGHLGRKVHELDNTPIARVSSLDPANDWKFGQNGYHTQKSDAKFVDVIHTATRFMAIGHMDFFPGGGDTQPGCANDFWCDHSRAVEYFAESISIPDTAFVATLCSSWALYQSGGCNDQTTANMGAEDPSTIIEGSYYLNVNAQSPFAQGDVSIATTPATTCVDDSAWCGAWWLACDLAWFKQWRPYCKATCGVC